MFCSSVLQLTNSQAAMNVCMYVQPLAPFDILLSTSYVINYTTSILSFSEIIM